MRSLCVLVGSEAVHDAKCAYYGSALWTILQAMTSGESSFPTWHDMFDKKKEKEQTADEIKNKILRDLRR